eukprot:9130652-Pyramimonas_sp.AAC.1
MGFEPGTKLGLLATTSALGSHTLLWARCFVRASRGRSVRAFIACSVPSLHMFCDPWERSVNSLASASLVNVRLYD